jgi:hypothetical protein
MPCGVGALITPCAARRCCTLAVPPALHGTHAASGMHCASTMFKARAHVPQAHARHALPLVRDLCWSCLQPASSC